MRSEHICADRGNTTAPGPHTAQRLLALETDACRRCEPASSSWKLGDLPRYRSTSCRSPSERNAAPMNPETRARRHQRSSSSLSPATKECNELLQVTSLGIGSSHRSRPEEMTARPTRPYRLPKRMVALMHQVRRPGRGWCAEGSGKVPLGHRFRQACGVVLTPMADVHPPIGPLLPAW